jgi:membrane protein YdbS with pleckstrin-like domain
MKQIYCSNCGTLVPGGANFCTNCGAPVHGSEAAVFRAQEPEVKDAQLVHSLPKQALHDEVDYIPMQHLPIDALIFFFLSFLGKSGIIFLLLLVGAVLQPNPFLYGLGGYFAVLGIVTMFVYNNFMYEIDKDGLKIASGVIFKHQVSLPYEQIQNVNIERTLLDRIFGFSRISIETAGSAVPAGTGTGVLKAKSEAYIPGLHLDQAKKVHDLLIDGADGAMGS